MPSPALPPRAQTVSGNLHLPGNVIFSLAAFAFALCALQIDYNDPAVRERILNTAVKRASNWMALAQKHAKPMVGQVGGISRNKKPLLTLAPDYVLKPIIADHRGFREIAFYEAIRTLTQTKHVQQAYSAFLTGRDQNQKSSSSSSPASSSSHHSSQNSSTTGSVQNSFSVQFCTYYNTALQYLGERMDTIAMALAIFCQDSIVLEAEVAVKESWRGLKREVDMIRQLQKFSPKYYGVMNLSSDNDDDNVERRDLKSNIKINDDKNNSNDNDGTGPFLSTLTSTRIQSTTPFGLTEDAHLLLQDLTINFSKPCVMDLKMGVQTYVSTDDI